MRVSSASTATVAGASSHRTNHTSAGPSGDTGGGSLASDEALQALREKLTGGQA